MPNLQEIGIQLSQSDLLTTWSNAWRLPQNLCCDRTSPLNTYRSAQWYVHWPAIEPSAGSVGRFPSSEASYILPQSLGFSNQTHFPFPILMSSPHSSSYFILFNTPHHPPIIFVCSNTWRFTSPLLPSPPWTSNHLNCLFVLYCLEFLSYTCKVRSSVLFISFAAFPQWYLPIDEIPHSFLWTSCYSEQFLPASHANTFYPLISSYINIPAQDLVFSHMCPHETAKRIHRIIYIENTYKIIKPNCKSNTAKPTTKPCP